jgi:hypothetical protein
MFCSVRVIILFRSNLQGVSAETVLSVRMGRKRANPSENEDTEFLFVANFIQYDVNPNQNVFYCGLLSYGTVYYLFIYFYFVVYSRNVSVSWAM